MTTPILRLELEGLRYQVLHALAQHHEKIEEHVDEAVKTAIEGFDVMSVVRREVEQVLQAEIRRGVASAIQKILWDDETRDKLEQVVREALKK